DGVSLPRRAQPETGPDRVTLSARADLAGGLVEGPDQPRALARAGYQRKYGEVPPVEPVREAVGQEPGAGDCLLLCQPGVTGRVLSPCIFRLDEGPRLRGCLGWVQLLLPGRSPDMSFHVI